MSTPEDQLTRTFNLILSAEDAITKAEVAIATATNKENASA